MTVELKEYSLVKNALAREMANDWAIEQSFKDVFIEVFNQVKNDNLNLSQSFYERAWTVIAPAKIECLKTKYQLAFENKVLGMLTEDRVRNIADENERYGMVLNPITSVLYAGAVIHQYRYLTQLIQQEAELMTDDLRDEIEKLFKNERNKKIV